MARSEYFGDFGWQTVTASSRGEKEDTLEGYARIPVSAIEAVYKKSGMGGVFVSRVRREEPAPRPVVWAPRTEGESDA
eukprot:12856676-Alexandrium_andersonii.AAC.1